MSNRGDATRTRTAKAKPLSVKQRGDKATLSLRQTLGLPATTNDAAVLGTALAIGWAMTKVEQRAKAA